MTTQINVRVTKDFFEQVASYAKAHGFLNVQEFLREVAREKIYGDFEVRTEYLERLKSKDATTYLSEIEAKKFEKELEKRAKLK